MNQKENLILAIVLAFVSVLVGLDVWTDFSEGVLRWHVVIEIGIGLSALFGLFYILRNTILLKKQLNLEKDAFLAYKKESEIFKAESKKFIDGLAEAIDQQLTKWNLTLAEKEVAFLLLKGLTLKEIAEVRATSEKTARVQSMAIYSKSGLSGRSELSAFFLEDLLLPNKKTTSD